MADNKSGNSIYDGPNQTTDYSRAHLDKVVKNSTSIKKETLADKFAKTFNKESLSEFGSYIFKEYVVPKVKDGLYAIMTGAIDTMFGFGNDKHREYDRGRTSYNYVSYDKYSRRPTRYAEPSYAQKAFSITSLQYDDIEFEIKKDAESVLMSMCDIIEQDGAVSIAQFYELADVPTYNYQYNKYGWTNLSTAYVKTLAGGKFTIKFPKAEEL